MMVDISDEAWVVETEEVSASQIEIKNFANQIKSRNEGVMTSEYISYVGGTVAL